ncbi:MAG: hypothetical protein ACXITV_00305 [Luteibaculaceae bacterium]
MHNDTKITLVGAGWLGFPLAIFWKNKGYQVAATTTNKEKLSEIEAAGLKAVPFIIGVHQPSELPEGEILFVNVPPSLKGYGSADKFKQFLQELMERKPKQFLLVSSTGVYGSNQTGALTEADKPMPDSTGNGMFLQACEQLVLQAGYTVLRPGGLFGPERNPANFYRSKGVVPNSEDAVNMIHQRELIKIADYLITNQLKGVYNAVSPLKISRAQFYGKAAEVNGLERLQFDGNFTNSKWVVPQNLLNLGYPFEHKTADLYL